MARRTTHDTLTRVPGVEVGHASDRERRTGVSVVTFERAAPTVVQILGGASATYDTGSLSLDATFGRRWAIFFAGGRVPSTQILPHRRPGARADGSTADRISARRPSRVQT